MAFSTKSNNTQTQPTASPEEWKAWSDYYYSLFDVKEEPAKAKDGSVIPNRFVKKTPMVGICKLIVDLGTQPQEDSVYTSKVAPPKSGEELSEEEKEHLKKFPNNYFFWDEKGVRMQGKPENPCQEYAISYDFPNIMVDWTKHPIEKLHKLGVKPLRVSYNSVYVQKGGTITLGRHLRLNPNLRTKQLSPNNPIYKLAYASNVGAQFEQEGYDLGVLVDTACKWDLSVTRVEKDDRTFFYEKIVNPTEITEVHAGNITVTVEQQIPECPTEFMGVLMNDAPEAYTPEMLDIISNRRDLMAVLPRTTTFKPSPIKYPDMVLGVAWEDTALCKALQAHSPEVADKPVESTKQEAKQPQEHTANSATEAYTAPKQPPVETPTVEQATVDVSDDEWEDDIPF